MPRLVIADAERAPTSQKLQTGGHPMCRHHTPCPSADAADRDAAVAVARHPEQGWNLLCNGVVVFDDTGEILPDGRVIDPHRGDPRGHAPAAA
jgi:hypothetical protein